MCLGLQKSIPVNETLVYYEQFYTELISDVKQNDATGIDFFGNSSHGLLSNQS